MPRDRSSPSVLLDDASRERAAAYIADRGLELALLARTHDHGLLAHLLDVAVREAHRRARADDRDEAAG